MKSIFKNNISTKFGYIVLLFILLQIPLNLISGISSERAQRQQEVRDEIASSSAGEQQLMGPLVHIRYLDPKERDTRGRPLARQKLILPKRFQLDAQMLTHEKYRGIYTARLYQADAQIQGQFDLSWLSTLASDDIQSVSLVMAISDSRGIGDLSPLSLGGQKLAMKPGTGLRSWPQGIGTELPLATLDITQPVPFSLNLTLGGMESLKVTPVGELSSLSLNSPWPHPSFVGDYLPVASSVGDTGFTAQWKTNNFSTNIEPLMLNCLENSGQCSALHGRQMGVRLIDPVDHYLKSHRAINYAVLVIALVFATFFLLELLQSRPIHPIQYSFVGLALALFYLLLLSLSEHIGFNLAYAAASLASVALLGSYVAGILGNRQGTLFSFCLVLLYGLLFGLLQAESYALLMGSILCFAVLSLLMMMTRKVNWYGKTATAPSQGD
ncbi:cell envelope integrity protein CreD [Ferrimonas futtsuensis]|uniref:cell envelope integrity protein CreD n=1 Tax=Ferrimonas futtsuensis TaxID=364764 RepID=UPI000400AF0A|nr:cell envelope integrity protein CreD [Ferrimonas futtsuensis]